MHATGMSDRQAHLRPDLEAAPGAEVPSRANEAAGKAEFESSEEQSEHVGNHPHPLRPTEGHQGSAAEAQLRQRRHVKQVEQPRQQGESNDEEELELAISTYQSERLSESSHD